ncbi:hypothetical protein L873DRAFT_1861490 [Choiromyces venosus 120613-1]|uniref:Uncharacterized protein n=1 Tax=Choiromyces venosus 120613-1 TaxID=1336337 RepID=A0A3N4J278_9PEZI|nr:hypothetical protein L873DRAFT_1861490 [Choiromyces venosus 120613-1]
MIPTSFLNIVFCCTLIVLNKIKLTMIFRKKVHQMRCQFHLFLQVTFLSFKIWLLYY